MSSVLKTEDDDGEHHDMNFFGTLLPQVKLIEPRDKLNFRNEVTQVVQKFAYPGNSRRKSLRCSGENTNVLVIDLDNETEHPKPPMPIPLPMPKIKLEKDSNDDDKENLQLELAKIKKEMSEIQHGTWQYNTSCSSDPLMQPSYPMYHHPNFYPGGYMNQYYPPQMQQQPLRQANQSLSTPQEQYIQTNQPVPIPIQPYSQVNHPGPITAQPEVQINHSAPVQSNNEACFNFSPVVHSPNQDCDSNSDSTSFISGDQKHATK